MREFEKLLDQLDEVTQGSDRVSVGDVRTCLGASAFAPILLTLGLVALSPIGDIPGAPTLMSVLIVLVAGQHAIGQERLWLPGFLLSRSVKAGRLSAAVRFLRRPARFLGRVIRSRWTFLTRGAFARAIAALCAVLAMLLPPLEFVPFGATVPSSAITIFGMSLVAHDGWLASAGLLATLGAVYLVATVVIPALPL